MKNIELSQRELELAAVGARTERESCLREARSRKWAGKGHAEYRQTLRDVAEEYRRLAMRFETTYHGKISTK